MALPLYSLGDFTFLGINGNAIPPKGVLSLDERPGVNGTEITDEGYKGRPFRIRSWVDMANYNAARYTLLQYCGLIRQDPVELVIHDISTATDGFLVQVLDVQPVLVTRIIPGKIGLNSPSHAWLECDWDLLPIEG